jgi:hypothetical protein
MSEVTYLSEVECKVIVAKGIRDTQVIRVTDAEGAGHTLRVFPDGLTETNGKKYLPVGLINVDRKKLQALVELPGEADSGTSRVWVALANFRRQDDA